MEKSVFAVTLLEDALIACCLGAHEAETGVIEDSIVALWLGVVMAFEITENDNSGFGSIGFSIAVGFDNEDTHRRQGLGDDIFL